MMFDLDETQKELIRSMDERAIQKGRRNPKERSFRPKWHHLQILLGCGIPMKGLQVVE